MHHKVEQTQLQLVGSTHLRDISIQRCKTKEAAHFPYKGLGVGDLVRR